MTFSTKNNSIASNKSLSNPNKPGLIIYRRRIERGRTKIKISLPKSGKRSLREIGMYGGLKFRCFRFSRALLVSAWKCFKVKLALRHKGKREGKNKSGNRNRVRAHFPGLQAGLLCRDSCRLVVFCLFEIELRNLWSWILTLGSNAHQNLLRNGGRAAPLIRNRGMVHFHGFIRNENSRKYFSEWKIGAGKKNISQIWRGWLGKASQTAEILVNFSELEI